MTEDRNDKPTATDQQTLDPQLKDQIETSLDGVYRFNAATAKYSVVWVWLLRLLWIGASVGAVVSLLGGLALVIAQSDIRAVPLDGTGRHHLLNLHLHQWMLFFGACGAFVIAALFFAALTKGIKHAYQTSMEMARKHQR